MAKNTVTHYVPWFTVQQGDRLAYAACGRFILRTEHSVEPSCPHCQAYLEAEAENQPDFGEPADATNGGGQ
jgi:hypothetical protein